jgi:hypothetical protein
MHQRLSTFYETHQCPSTFHSPTAGRPCLTARPGEGLAEQAFAVTTANP